GYCMPRESFGADYAFMPSSERLSFAQLEKIAHAFTSLGVEKIRITGGEPLLRRHLEALIERLAALTTIDGKPVEIASGAGQAMHAHKHARIRGIAPLGIGDVVKAGRARTLHAPLAGNRGIRWGRWHRWHPVER
ncbi:hypothetical protein M3202_22125, partial [Alkalihalobacillus oceani]|nr:hypothetical protein [Halalkalibacter oceani]